MEIEFARMHRVDLAVAHVVGQPLPLFLAIHVENQCSLFFMIASTLRSVWRWRRASGESSAINLPLHMMATRSQIDSTSCMLWVVRGPCRPP